MTTPLAVPTIRASKIVQNAVQSELWLVINFQAGIHCTSNLIIEIPVRAWNACEGVLYIPMLCFMVMVMCHGNADPAYYTL